MQLVKAISLWQPWATAIAIGAKVIETRHWDTSYRGPLVIHAAKTKECLHDYETRRIAGIGDYDQLPLGALVAVAELVDCRPTSRQFVRELIIRDRKQLARTANREFALGDHSDGRFGWVLDNVRALPQPVPYTGRQGLFDIPASVLGIEL